MPITAAEFLHHFAGDVPGPTSTSPARPTTSSRPYLAGKGASGFGVRLLVELLTRFTP